VFSHFRRKRSCSLRGVSPTILRRELHRIDPSPAAAAALCVFHKLCALALITVPFELSLMLIWFL
jgi:hypothetical protein